MKLNNVNKINRLNQKAKAKEMQNRIEKWTKRFVMREKNQFIFSATQNHYHTGLYHHSMAKITMFLCLNKRSFDLLKGRKQNFIILSYPMLIDLFFFIIKLNSVFIIITSIMRFFPKF